VGLALVFLAGAAAGFAVGVPGLIERVGQGVIVRLADRLEVALDARDVTWSFGGVVDIEGLVVRDRRAPVGEPPLFTAERMRVISEVDVLARRVRVDEIHVEGVTGRLIRREGGGDNLRRLLSAARELLLREPPAGAEARSTGLAVLVRAVPRVTVDGAELWFDLPAVDAPLGLDVPRRVILSEGRITLAPAEGEGGAEAIALDARFADTSLDPGHGLSVDAVVRLDGAPERLGARFDRPARFYVGDRVAGIRGVAWTPEAAVLSDLQLSVVYDPDDHTGSLGAAATVASLRVEPEPRTLLARALLARADGRAWPVDALLESATRVVVEQPAVVVRFGVGGRHSFEDLLPVLRLPGFAGAPPRVPRPVDVITEASLAASGRLAQGSPARPPRVDVRERVARGSERLVASVDRRAGRLAEALRAFPLTELEIIGGHVSALDARDRPWSVERLDLHARALADDGLELAVEAVIPDVTRRPVRLQVAHDPGDGTLEVELSLAGLPLALLADALPGPLRGQGDGLVHDSELRLWWRPDGWTARGQVRLHGLRVDLPALAPEPMTGLDVALEGTVAFDRRREALVVSDVRVERGGLSVALEGRADRALTAPRLELAARLAPTPVQVVADALPRPMMRALEGLRVGGELAWEVFITLDTTDIDGLVIDSRPRLTDFVVRSLGGRVDLDALRSAITYAILYDDGSVGARTTGPLSVRWVPLEDISPHMVQAVLTTEDGSFHRHRGISPFAIRESIVTNLRRGGFARGASTITQQLVKNLFLGPEKTLARKLQEMFIAWRVEEALTKDEIMTLYLNVIEFGPGIYGVGEAAEHWFGKAARDLSPLEAMFLASIIPNPRRYYSFFEHGAVSARWRNYLRVLLDVMADRGRLSPEEAAAQAPYDPIFRGRIRPGAAAPEGTVDEGELIVPEGPE